MKATATARTRKHGTEVITATTYDELITAARHVLAHGYAKVNGQCLDATTASMLVQVRDKLNERNLTAVRAAFTRLADQARNLLSTIPDGPLKKRALTPEEVATCKVIDICWKAIR